MVNTGVSSLNSLLHSGWTAPQIESAVRAGTLVRIKRGWFAQPGAPSAVVEAISVGGRLGCLSGCKFHGVWTPRHADPHVLIHRGDARRKESWHRHTGPLPESAVFPLLECLTQVLRHHSAEEALVVLESATNQGKVSRNQAELLICQASMRKQRSLQFFNPAAQSGSETKVRLWLHLNRNQVAAQVHIPGVGTVDHVVGQSLIIECDSDEFHRYREEDYRRDMAAKALGYTTIRLSYHQIHHTWEETTEMLLRLLRTGQHLRPPRPL